MMSNAVRHIDFIDDLQSDLNEPKTFSSVVNNDDILQMYLKILLNIQKMQILQLEI